MAKKKEVLPAYGLIQQERMQVQPTRKHLYEQIEKELGVPVVTYFTSFTHPVMIDADDVQIIEQALQVTEMRKGCALLISSPGGDGLAAENLINLFREYSGSGKYTAIVPRRAKSAATMVCFGADSVMMGPAGELGPVDPQVRTQEGVFSLCNVVDSYEELFNRAANLENGRIDPFLLQLARYDHRVIAEYKGAIALAKDIAVKALKSGMMGGMSAEEIEKKIAPFLTPKHTKSHGRAIYAPEAKRHGINIERINKRSRLWRLIYELYMRVDNYVNSNAAKCIETKDQSFVVAVSEFP